MASIQQFDQDIERKPVRLMFDRPRTFGGKRLFSRVTIVPTGSVSQDSARVSTMSLYYRTGAPTGGLCHSCGCRRPTLMTTCSSHAAHDRSWDGEATTTRDPTKCGGGPVCPVGHDRHARVCL